MKVFNVKQGFQFLFYCFESLVYDGFDLKNILDIVLSLFHGIDFDN